MSVLDQLAAQTERQRTGVAQTEASPAPRAAALPPAHEPPANGPTAAYFAYWIAAFEEAEKLPLPEAEQRIDARLRQAPAPCQPDTPERRLFALAGGTVLPYREVAEWLRLREALHRTRPEEGEGTIHPEIARVLLRHLGPEREEDDGDTWIQRYQRARLALQERGLGELSAAVSDGLQAHPAWVRAYLRCGSAKARLVQPAPAPEAATSDGAHARAAPGAVERPDSARLGSSPSLAGGFPTAPVGLPNPVSAPGSGLGFTLGTWAGGLVGGILQGLKTGVARRDAEKPSPRNGSAEASSIPFSDPSSTTAAARFWSRRVHRQADARARSLVQANAEAEEALRAFQHASERVRHHPNLQSFWDACDAQADTRFRGDRAAVFREMRASPGGKPHFLQALLEKRVSDDPHVGLCYEEAYAAWERLHKTWHTCAQIHQQEGQGWSPTPQQLRQLHEAARQVPPGAQRALLVERAEQLVRALATLIHQAFSRMAAAPAARPKP